MSRRSRRKGAWRWLVACVAAGVVLAITLALSLGAPARAEGDDADGETVEQTADGQDGATEGSPAEGAASDGAGGQSDATPVAAPDDQVVLTDAGDGDPVVAADATDDDWHDANGLPNYGVRIVLDKSAHQEGSGTNYCFGLDIRVRAKSATSDGVVLEKYRWDEAQQKYVLLADQHLTVPKNNWGSENYSTDDQCVWLDGNGFYNVVWRYGHNLWNYDTMEYGNGPADGSTSWYEYTSGAVFDYNYTGTDWRRMAMFVHEWGNRSDISTTSYTGFFSNTADVYVLRAADTSTGALVAGKSSADYEYEIEGTRYGSVGVTYGLNTSAGADTKPNDITEWQDLSYGAYGDFTGVRDIPTGGVETIDLKNNYNRQTQSWMNFYGPAAGNSNMAVIRNDASNYTDAMPVSVTVFSPTDNYNFTPEWSNFYINESGNYRNRDYPDFQLAVRAWVYSYDPNTGNYSWVRDVPDSSMTGVHLGSQTAYGRLNTTLEPNQVLVIAPMYTQYAFTYRIETGSGYQIDSVDDNSRGTVTNHPGMYSEYNSGLVANFEPYDGSVRRDDVVLHTSTSGATADAPVLGADFTQLTSGNIGTGKEMRSLKVNLFDYDIPDDWHFTEGNDNSQGDVEFRFVSDSDGSSNLQDPAVDLVNAGRRRSPYQGILQDQLNAATGLPTFNYTTPFENDEIGGLFSLTAGTQTVGTAYKWAVTTHGTTQYYYPNYTEGRGVFQLADPNSPDTWYDYGDAQDSSISMTYTNTRTKAVYAGVDFDFIYNQSNGYYSYDSSRNHAQLTSDGSAVHQYDHALGMGGTNNWWGYADSWGSSSTAGDNGQGVADTNGQRAAGFFPFDSYETTGGESHYGTNYYGKSYAFKPAMNNDNTTLLRKEEDLDYHFGMSTTQTFAIPEGGTVHGQDMIFSFSGDDDFWLYVDGKLVLDIGGIHEACPGSINFTKGTYTVDDATYSLNDIFPGYTSEYPSSTDPAADGYAGSGDWAAGTTHTFTMFYLERGGTFSNLSMRFNTPIVVATAEKVWDDDNDAAGLRKEATLALESTEGTVTADSTWTTVEDSRRVVRADENGTARATWTGYPMMRWDATAGQNIPIHYRVVENDPTPGYTPTVSVQSSVAKTWVTSDNTGNWTATSKALPKYDANGNLITYTVALADDNTAEGTGTLTCTSSNSDATPVDPDEADVAATTTVTATMAWTDGADHSSDVATVNILDGDTVVDTVTLSGKSYATLLGEDNNAFLVTNTVSTTTVEVAKRWSDGTEAHADDSVTVYVLDDAGHTTTNNPADTITLSADNDWQATSKVLPAVVSDGNGGTRSVTYRVVENDSFEDYDTTVSVWDATNKTWVESTDASYASVLAQGGTSFSVFRVTNTHHEEPATTSVKVTKAWDDQDDKDGIRPDSVTFHLLANGEDTGKSVQLTADNNWTATFDGLDVNDADGKAIAYSVCEDVPDGYTASDPEGDAATGFTITNTHTPEQPKQLSKTTTTTKTVLPNTGDPSSIAGIVAGLLSGSGTLAAAVATRRRSRR